MILYSVQAFYFYFLKEESSEQDLDLMTTMLEIKYLRYERSELERDEIQFSVPHVDYKIQSFPKIPAYSSSFLYLFSVKIIDVKHISHIVMIPIGHIEICKLLVVLYGYWALLNIYFFWTLENCREKWIQFSSGEEQYLFSQFREILRVLLPRAWEHKLLPRASWSLWEYCRQESRCRERCLLKQYLRNSIMSFGAI